MFLISLLYAAQSLFVQMQIAGAAALTQEMPASVLVALSPLAGQYGELIAVTLTAAICVRRALKLSRWLAQPAD